MTATNAISAARRQCAAGSECAGPASFKTSVAVLLHLLPGAATAAAYVGLVPIAHRVGLPSIAALAASALIAIAPIELGIVVASDRRARVRGIARPEGRVRQLPTRSVVIWTAAVVAMAALGFAVSGGFSESLRQHAFSWWPASWNVRNGTSGGFSEGSLAITAALVILGSVVVAPVVEEIYFRGFLLPRMPAGMGRLAPIAHCSLFALYHLWTPWMFPTRAIAIVPLVYVFLHTKDLRIATYAHSILNAVDAIAIIAFMVSR